MVTVEGFDFPDDLLYTDDQIWVKKEDGKVRIGLTAFGADLAGKIKFVRLRPAGKDVKAGKSIGTMESGKWTGPIKTPFAGVLAEVNDELKNNPGLLNDDPFGAGWIAVVEPENYDGDAAELQGAAGLEGWIKAQIAEKKPS
ncbi:MAG: glycine cleavage system protein H [Candidatus Thorarchaeota archaeon]|nr:MAG: glycine cleavage system protein H [Candidatus Thorarchaeota archaeon]